MTSAPFCHRCLVSLPPGEPYAVLAISHRLFEAETILVFDAFGVVSLCRICGEQLQLTSPEIGEAEKLARVAAAASAVHTMLTTLPALPSFPLADPNPWEQCWRCAAVLTEPDAPSWIECTLTYERYELQQEAQRHEVLDTYVTRCLCEDCCALLPLPALDSHSHAVLWVGAFARMGEG